MTADATLADIAPAHRVRLIVQFGSSVTGRRHPGSDIDLAVLVECAPLTLDAYSALVADLQRCYPDRPVDVAVLNHADPLFLKQIFDTARLLHGPVQLFQELRIGAFKRYQDHRRSLALEREVVARRLGAGPSS